VTTVDVLDVSGNKAGTVELPAEIFDVQVNIPLIHQVVVAQQAAARQGTHSTKTRGEVSGGGAKPYRQKGTGRARQGSIRAPQYAGGGVVHGPTPHGYAQRTPKKMKAAALRAALSDRARDGRLHVVEGLVDGSTPSTKSAVGMLAKITTRPRVLVVLARGDKVTWLSLRNLDIVHTLNVDQLNTYDVLVSDDVVFTTAAYEQFIGSPLTGKSVKAVATSTEAAAEGVAVAADEATDEVSAPVAKKRAAKKAAPADAEKAEKSEAGEAKVDESAADGQDEKPAKKAAAKKTTAKTTTAAPAKTAAAKKTTTKKAAAKPVAEAETSDAEAAGSADADEEGSA